MGNDTTNDAVAEEAAENFARYAETMGGRVRLNWDEWVEMSTNAHHVLFSEFLAVSGLFDRFVEESPSSTRATTRPRSGTSSGRRSSGSWTGRSGSGTSTA